MESLLVVAVMAATVASGLLAGVFVLYAHTVMPALGRCDDRTFVAAFQALDRAILNGWFLTVFFVAPVTAAVATALGLDTTAWFLLLGALLLEGGSFAVTVAVHLPRNDAIKAAGDPDEIDVAAARAAFDEAAWTRWNLVRAVSSTAAFALLVWALVVVSSAAFTASG